MPQANPELMSQAMKMFRSMDRQQMEQLARSMGGPGTAGGAPDAAAMSAMLKDPESAMMVKNMMSQLTPKQLVQMSEASGSKITPQQVAELLMYIGQKGLMHCLLAVLMECLWLKRMDLSVLCNCCAGRGDVQANERDV